MENDKYFYTVYYKGEDESPVESGNYKLYWWYEKCYFLQTDNPNEEDFKEYEFTREFADGEEFTSFAIKIVSKSSSTTIVPIIDDLRIICLGT